MCLVLFKAPPGKSQITLSVKLSINLSMTNLIKEDICVKKYFEVDKEKFDCLLEED